MNRVEALNILGLDDDATEADIKSAYKECAQILHPDRFASNKKLQDRATEQFKRLQDAYEYLTSGKGSKSSASSRRPRQPYTAAEAKIAGLEAAKAQLTAQLDAATDQRRNAILMALGGLVAAVFLRRIVWIAGIAGAALVYGIVTMAATQRTITTLEEHLQEIEIQKRQIEEEEDDE